MNLYRREEHTRRLEELKRRQSDLTKCDNSATIKELRDLRCRIEELETKNDKLRSCLLEEREKREKAEAKLSEIDSTRGRMSFIMVRGVTIPAPCLTSELQNAAALTNLKVAYEIYGFSICILTELEMDVPVSPVMSQNI